MNTITQTEMGLQAGYAAQAAGNSRTSSGSGTTKAGQAADSSSVKKTRVTHGKTIGEPKLSESAQKYYEKLKKKYSNLDFILVSSDMKEQAEANAGRYADKNRTVVLIDEEKIERMAADEDYRKQYEGIINNATKQLSQIKDSLGLNAGKVKTYGIKVDDGGNASFFAVIDKSYAAQRDRIEKKAEQKAADKKKAEKAAEEKRMEEARTQKAKDKDKTGKYDEEDTVTVTADSVEELLKKINDVIFRQMSDSTRTVQEQQVGQKFDFAI